MFMSAILEIFSSIFYFALHVVNTGKLPPALSKDEEAFFLQNMQMEGDLEAKNKLIEHNLRLVAHVIKKYYANGYDQDDLISIGTIGLIKAINTFRTDKNIKLATYASRCIENEILMYFRNAKKSAQDVSINDPIETDRDGNALTLIDVIADEIDIPTNIDTKINVKKLKGYIEESLTSRERTIIEYRYGLNGKPELTQREIAKKLQISRSYVSRIEKKALSTLYQRFSSNEDAKKV